MEEEGAKRSSHPSFYRSLILASLNDSVHVAPSDASRSAPAAATAAAAAVTTTTTTATPEYIQSGEEQDDR